MHLVHHSRIRNDADSNYGTFLTVWDRLFDTYHSPVIPAEIGVDGFEQPHNQTVLGMLATPFR